MTSKLVLIADDNCDAADTLGLVLGLSGHRLLVAYDGLAALELAERERPTVAVLDIGMPVLDGYQVAERIRQADWGQDMLLIALTGWAADDGHPGGATLFDHHLVKPVDPLVLEQLIDGARVSG
jgi:CheY-like chemotaxis protein